MLPDLLGLVDATILLDSAVTSETDGTPIHRTLSSLPPGCPARIIYPEDFFPNGSYWTGPFGQVRAVLRLRESVTGSN
jgi:hypothetical protein